MVRHSRTRSAYMGNDERTDAPYNRLLNAEQLMMSTEITYTEAEANLKNLCDRAVETGELIVITRPNGKNAVLISEAELESLLETLYLLRSPANATRLFAALKRAKSRVIQPQTLDEICQKFGINEEDDSENEVAIAS
ncbi:type II toxin-antitoxin system prevent-host-death family antitoxin [Microcoleus sp. N3A4]|uniref:type II toxin-antitoxin system prevent-host-death family antitoxin n=2 Tax=unclassified Microcoleus TaxID=2642155 RepID=UPI002FCFB27A